MNNLVSSSPRDAYGKTLLELGKKNTDIVALDADLSKSTKTAIFAEAFPDRFFDMGVAEADMVNTAAGIASCGFTVFASTFAMFLTGRAWEQIRNTVAYGNFDVKLVATHAGITVGPDGSSHQAIEDIALMTVIPNMKVLAPCDSISTKRLITQASESRGPFYFRLPRGKTFEIHKDSEKIDLGKACLIREGSDMTIFSHGLMVYNSLLAAEKLSRQGIEAAVVDVHTIKPIDQQLVLERAEISDKILVAEEHSVNGGLCSALALFLARNRPVKMRFVAIEDQFGRSGSESDLLTHYGLDETSIFNKSMELFK
ncbi:transketolase family protein [candidate division WOR-3 bacterium]|nr:transketolase family protein [candidate division WOR-3 bacterium]